MKPHLDKRVTDYWLKYYVSEALLCSLCGNQGVIDTRGACSQAGVPAGRLNYCICPNGQAMRLQGVALHEPSTR